MRPLFFSFLFLAGLPASTPAMATEYDLNLPVGSTNTAPHVVAFGKFPNDQLGLAQVVGDFNGDGRDDWFVLSNRADVGTPNRVDPGVIYGWFGRTNEVLTLDAAGTAGIAPDIEIWGEGPGSALGENGGLRMYDLNADGRMDLVVTAHMADRVGQPPNDNAGKVHMIWGRQNPPARVDLAGTQGPAADVTLVGASAEDRLGLNGALAAGDVNGDNLPDLVVGAYLADGPLESRPAAGEAYVVLGRTNFPSVINLASNASVTVYGATEFDRLANSGPGSIQVEDVDADGFDDLLFTVDNGDGPGEARDQAGEVCIIRGRASFPATLDLATQGAGGYNTVIYGKTESDRLGSSSALRVGDVNGDGRPDLVLGAGGADALGGARTSAGEVYVLFGRPAGFPAVMDLSAGGNQAADVTIAGAANFDNLAGLAHGLQLADLNGDQVEDLALISENADPTASSPDSGSSIGEMYLLYGRANWSTNLNLALVGGGGADASFRGISAERRVRGGPPATLRDVNRDGRADVTVCLGQFGAYPQEVSQYATFHSPAGGFPPVTELANAIPDQIINAPSDPFDPEPHYASGGYATGDFNGDSRTDFFVTSLLTSSDPGTRPDSGVGYLIMADHSPPSPARLSLSDNAWQFFLRVPPLAGGCEVDPFAECNAPAGTLDGAELEVAITSNYVAGVDTFHFLTSDDFSPDNSGAGGIWHKGKIVAQASVNGGVARCVFNANADGSDVRAVLANLRYENSELHAGWFRQGDDAYPSRAVSVRLGLHPAIIGQLEFPYIGSLKIVPEVLRLSVHPEETNCSEGLIRVDALLSNYQIVHPSQLTVIWTPSVMDDGCREPMRRSTNRATGRFVRTVELDTLPIVASSGSLSARGIVIGAGDYCLVVLLKTIIISLAAGFPAVGDGFLANDVSLPDFHALEALMRRTIEGRRLADAYRRHMFEASDLALSDMLLLGKLTSLILSFQPGVSALLRGDGDRVALSPDFINDLRAAWNLMKSQASPALREAMQLEQDRLHDFNDLAGLSFAQAAILNGIEVPNSPVINIYQAGPVANGHLMQANAVQGVTPTLWRSGDLLSWAQVTDAAVITTNGTFRVTDPAPPAGANLYQLRW